MAGAALIVGAASLFGFRTTAATAPTSPPSSGSPALAPFAEQPVRWHDCQVGPNDPVGATLDAAGAQCAEVSVPLDYSHPAGRTISLGVARIRAADQAHRHGPLMINLGGPGGSVVDALPDIRELVGPVVDRFDLIGMDPRFVGRSSALDCGPALADDWIRAGGPDRASFERVAREQAATAAACAQHAGVLPFASTRNTARDMDIVRAVLGEEKTSYFGYSYGTYLGAVYMQLFPGRVDRFVLDSAVDPATFNPRVLSGTGDLLEAALREWAGWAAGHDAQFGLGRTAAQVMATVDRIYAAAERGPLTVDGVAHDSSGLPGLLLNSLASDSEEASETTAMGVRAFADAADGRTPGPSPHLDEFLEGAATGGPEPAGGGEPPVPGSLSAFLSAQLAVVCADVPASRIAEEYLADIRRRHRSQPHVARAIWNLTPCSYWPVRPVEPPTRVANGVPALIVAAERDNRTPYRDALALRRALTASRLVTLRDARLHGVFPGNSPCVDDAVVAYLRAGELPGADLSCTRPSPDSR